MKYYITDILHSGRKGRRDKRVSEGKYEGVIGSIIETKNIRETKPLEKHHWTFVETQSPYEWWDTSETVALTYNEKEKLYYLETINTIYILEEIGE